VIKLIFRRKRRDLLDYRELSQQDKAKIFQEWTEKVYQPLQMTRYEEMIKKKKCGSGKPQRIRQQHEKE